MTLNSNNPSAVIGRENFAGVCVEIPNEARILIVSDEDHQADLLTLAFAKAGFASELATNITDGCDAAKSGRFQVVVTVPFTKDGSWRRLVDVTKHCDLKLEVVLLARTFDLTDWVGALSDGAFDVLNVGTEMHTAARVASAAFWAAYLKGSGRLPLCLSKSQKVHEAA